MGKRKERKIKNQKKQKEKINQRNKSNIRGFNLTRFWLGFFMEVKWLGLERTKEREQVRNMIFCMGLPCLKYFLKM